MGDLEPETPAEEPKPKRPEPRRYRILSDGTPYATRILDPDGKDITKELMVTNIEWTVSAGSHQHRAILTIEGMAIDAEGDVIPRTTPGQCCREREDDCRHIVNRREIAEEDAESDRLCLACHGNITVTHSCSRAKRAALKLKSDCLACKGEYGEPHTCRGVPAER